MTTATNNVVHDSPVQTFEWEAKVFHVRRNKTVADWQVFRLPARDEKAWRSMLTKVRTKCESIMLTDNACMTIQIHLGVKIMEVVV